MARPLCVGKRSLMRTTTLLPVAGQRHLHARAEGPVRVGRRERVLVERSPLAVFFPSNPGPYQDAIPSTTVPTAGHSGGGNL